MWPRAPIYTCPVAAVQKKPSRAVAVQAKAPCEWKPVGVRRGGDGGSMLKMKVRGEGAGYPNNSSFSGAG